MAGSRVGCNFDTDIITYQSMPCSSLLNCRCLVGPQRYMKGVQPASQPASQPDQTGPAQPNPIRGHGESKPHVHDGSSQEPPRVRKEMGEEEMEGQKKREKQRDENRPPPQPIVVHLSSPTLILVKPGPQSAMASSRLSGLSMFPKTLPAPLQTATLAIGLVRLQTTIPRLLSSQPAPCLTPPARCGTAGKGR